MTVSVTTASVNTDNEQRDGHLKSADFFDAEQFPNITFKSDSFKATGDSSYNIAGKPNNEGVTKPVTVKAKYLGENADAYGQTYSLWKMDFSVNRQDYGVSFNKTNAAGDYVLGEEVRLSINAKFIKT